MSPVAEFTPQGGYLLVKALTPWTFNAAKQVIDGAKEAAIAQGHDYILFDLTAWIEVDTGMTRFRSGEYLARQFTPRFKLAAFALPEMIDSFGENAAVNRGARFRIFATEQEAIAWLLGLS
ncbi:MAG: hypothetical protein Fur0042_09420 [Cyanophyceae cyanobacterium]